MTSEFDLTEAEMQESLDILDAHYRGEAPMSYAEYDPETGVVTDLGMQDYAEMNGTATRSQGGCCAKRRRSRKRAAAALRAAQPYTQPYTQPCRRTRTSASRARPSRSRLQNRAGHGIQGLRHLIQRQAGLFLGCVDISGQRGKGVLQPMANGTEHHKS